MTKKLLRATQIFIFLNFLIQLFWVTFLSFPKMIHFTLEQLELLLLVIAISDALGGVFIGIYLSKNRFKISFYALILSIVYYIFILVFWYQLIQDNVKLEQYKIAYYGLLAISFLFGLSLLLSAARNKIWIKRIGVLVIASTVITISVELFSVSGQSSFMQIIRLIESYARGIIPIFWILNFQAEIKLLPHENETLIDSPK